MLIFKKKTALVLEVIHFVQNQQLCSLKNRRLKEILDTTGGTGVMHEGFSVDDASRYNRDDFGWANAQFAEWVLDTWLNGPESRQN